MEQSNLLLKQVSNDHAWVKV